jgi:hypothetical protein
LAIKPTNRACLCKDFIPKILKYTFEYETDTNYVEEIVYFVKDESANAFQGNLKVDVKYE